MPKTFASPATQSKDPIREATIGTLNRVLDPLIELMFDSGVTVHDFNQLIRDRAVRAAAARVSRETGRASNSRVAIITGLARSEVARILNSVDTSSKKRLGQQPARRILAAWFDGPRFLAPNGEPAVLPIFGKRKSFEQLVATYGGGIPVRAMLDELTQINAVEILSDQRVSAKSRLPISTGLTDSAVSVIGERTRDLLDTLTSNLRKTSSPLFEATALLSDADIELVSVVRREIVEQAENFINSANSLLSRSGVKQSRPLPKVARCRLGVTVFYFQDEIRNAEELKKEGVKVQRKNLRRQQRVPRAQLKTLRQQRSVTKVEHD